MSYPAGAPLPSSKITLIIFDDGILGGIIPIYLENKSLSKSLVRVISLTLYKFSNTRIENLIKIKGTGDCNIIHTDCAIALETWSGKLLENRPGTDFSKSGMLISFNYPRKVQLYISATGMYTRINQGPEDYNSWLSWIKCNN